MKEVPLQRFISSSSCQTTQSVNTWTYLLLFCKYDGDVKNITFFNQDGFPCVLFHPSSSHCILSTSSSCVNQHHLKTACCKVMQHIQPKLTFLIACILHLNLPSCSSATCLFRNTATQIIENAINTLDKM